MLKKRLTLNDKKINLFLNYILAWQTPVRVASHRQTDQQKYYCTESLVSVVQLSPAVSHVSLENALSNKLNNIKEPLLKNVTF